MNIENGLAEGQVLQRLGSRGATVNISGRTSETGPVFATISGAKGVLKGWKNQRVGKSAQGKFTAILRGIPAGGPYRLNLQVGKEKAIRRAFYVGDVWLMAGQSNMEGCGSMAAPAKPHPMIRTFSMRHEWRLATDPLHLLKESPDACHNGGTQVSPEEGEKLRHTVKTGVGVGVFFGREMLKRFGVPQGLIATAHGGTNMAQWNPEGKDSMYSSMLASVRATGQPVAGMLWYQGESETMPLDTPPYTDRMKKLVAATRRDFRQPNLPWIIVQISRFNENRIGNCWNSIQEQQRLLPNKIKNFEMVASVDLPFDDMVHIGAEGFPVLGTRMAIAASRFIGGEKMRPPQLLKVVQTKFDSVPGLEVTFGSVKKGLKSEGPAHGFCLLDPAGKAIPSIYKTTLHGNVARLYCSSIVIGSSLHYGYGTYPICNITDDRNFSLPVFGPIFLPKPVALLPFVKQWKATGIIAAQEPFSPIACPDVDALGGEAKSYEEIYEGFINERERWIGKSGHGYFSSILELSEPMKLRFLMGYDGPFRLWVDGELLFQDLNGINPCFPDQSKKSLALEAGRHRVTVAMDLNNGQAWGFFLRFIREDVSPAQLKEKNYSTPTYLI